MTNDDTYTEIGKRVFQVLNEAGYLITVSRDIQIREEFLHLRDCGTQSKIARELLSEKYFLGSDAIKKIVYKKDIEPK